MTYPPVRWHDVACSNCCNEAQRLAVQQAGQMPPAHPHTPPTLSSNRLPTHTPPYRQAGQLLPAIGLGVYRSAAGGECYATVLSALKLGYRHIDTAQVCNARAWLQVFGEQLGGRCAM